MNKTSEYDSQRNIIKKQLIFCIIIDNKESNKKNLNNIFTSDEETKEKIKK